MAFAARFRSPPCLLCSPPASTLRATFDRYRSVAIAEGPRQQAVTRNDEGGCPRTTEGQNQTFREFHSDSKWKMQNTVPPDSSSPSFHLYKEKRPPCLSA